MRDTNDTKLRHQSKYPEHQEVLGLDTILALCTVVMSIYKKLRYNRYKLPK